MNREVDLRGVVSFLHFAAGTFALNLVLLGLFGIAGSLLLSVAAALLRRWPRAAERFDFWRPYLLAAWLLAPLLSVAADGLFRFRDQTMSWGLQRRLTFGLTFAFVLCAAAALRWLLRSVRHFDRAMIATALILALPVLTALAIPARATARVKRRPPAGAPNILLISIDTLRADHVHAWGYPRATSPNLDRFGQEGAIFRETFAPTSWTLPSHLTLLTSLPPEQHGVIADVKRLPEEIPTLPEILGQRGYDTAGFVSAAYLDGRFGFSKGFDEYDDYSVVKLTGGMVERQIASPTIARLAIDYLTRHTKAKNPRPFFLFAHFFDVHEAYIPPPPYDEMFGHTRNDRHKRRVELYDGEVAWTDHHVGMVLDELRRLGLSDNTIVVICADHGEEFYEHGDDGHHKTLYDEVLHVPLIMRYPGHIPAGLRIDKQVRLMDVMPTILSLAGFTRKLPEDPSGEHSTDLSPLFDPATASAFPDLPAFGDLHGRLASVRTPTSKFIENLVTHHQEAYDLTRDPREQKNLAGASPEAAVLRADLTKWRAFCEQRQARAVRNELDEEQKRALRSLGYMQ